MISREEFENLVNGLKSKVDETTGALLSEDLLQIIANYTLAIDEINKLNESVTKLNGEKEQLLMVNGKLYQQIGFDDKSDTNETGNESEEEISIDDIISEEGELI